MLPKVRTGATGEPVIFTLKLIKNINPCLRTIEDEIRWIEHNDTRILQNAKIIYNLKIHEDERRTERNSRMLDAILPFPKLEELHTKWVEEHKS